MFAEPGFDRDRAPPTGLALLPAVLSTAFVLPAILALPYDSHSLPVQSVR